MLSLRTRSETSAKRFARRRAAISRFIFSVAFQMYSALESRRALAYRPLDTRRSSGHFKEIAFIYMPFWVSLEDTYLSYPIERPSRLAFHGLPAWDQT